MAVLPAWDIEACVREAERAKVLGLRGVNLTSDPQDIGGPDLASLEWDPLWDVCDDLELPIHFHIGASLTAMSFFGNYPWPSQTEDVKLSIGGTLLFIGNARVVVNIIASGLLDRHPGLKIVSVESGAGWVPFILQALDYEMSENSPKERDALSMSPTEFFKRNIYATMWFEKTNLPALVASIGEDNILFETDFPHPTCLYPDPLVSAEENMRELSVTTRNKILGGNAKKLYKL
jgi:predicted TIM-barrel fold metal-dependent hydrolase